MKRNWEVDISRFIELIAVRLYSDPIRAGIRELIVNGLDARINQVEIWIDYDDIRRTLKYSDTGMGIDPDSFSDIYGKIASHHRRQKDARGFFGIGRMSLIAASAKGAVMSYKDGKIYKWSFNKEGWEGPEIAVDKDQIGHGVYLEFKEIDLGNLGEIEKWLLRTFSIPLLKKECTINFQHARLSSLINRDYTEKEQVETKYGPIQFYIKEEMDGTLYICQKGILVREEPYTGLTAYVNQEFLDVKTDREGFVNNEKYRFFKSKVKKELAKLRPIKSFKQIEVDFIRRLMREFKRYWTKKVKVNNIMEKIDLEFPEEGKEILKEPISSKELSFPEERTSITSVSSERSSSQTIEERETVLEEETHLPERAYEESSAQIELKKKEISEIPRKKEQKIVKIKGAKPVDLGEEYPMIFFESDPFVLVFNTSHPIFRKLIEKGKLGSHQLAVLFERMFEAAYSDEHKADKEELKERWKEVDLKLKRIFK